MYKYWLFSYNVRFGGKGGMNDCDLRFNSSQELVNNLSKIKMPTDPMYSYSYQLVNTHENVIDNYYSKGDWDLEGKDIEEIRDKRIRDVLKWLKGRVNDEAINSINE